jgi:hypothetical protein
MAKSEYLPIRKPSHHSKEMVNSLLERQKYIMHPDNILKQWAKINDFDLEDVVDTVGWPSEWNFEPYFEELQHIIKDRDEENYQNNFGDRVNPTVPFPLELIAYALSEWSGSDVPINHPLVKDHKKWMAVYHDTEYDLATPESEKQLWQLVNSIAKGELLSNLSSEDEVTEHANSPSITGKLYTITHDDQLYHFAVDSQIVAFMDADGAIKVFDYNGNRLYKDQELPKIQSYITGGIRMSKPITDLNELASLLGNKLSDLIIGKDSISVLDLP